MKEYNYSDNYKKSQTLSIVLMVVSFGLTVAFCVLALITGTEQMRKIKSKTAQAPTISAYVDLAAYGTKKDTIVTLTSDDVHYIDYATLNDKVVAWYYFALLPDSSVYISVRSSKNFQNLPRGTTLTFSGVLRNDPYRTLDLEMFSKYFGVEPEDAQLYLADFELSDEYNAFPLFKKRDDNIEYMWLTFALFGGLAGLAILFGSFKSERRNYKSLVGFMPLSDAETFFQDDILRGDQVTIAGNTLTKNWLYCGVTGSNYLIPAQEVVWAHKIITQHTTNGIKTGKTYSANVYLSNGTTVLVATKKISEQEIDQILEYMVNNWPKTLVGWDPEKKKMWNKKDTRQQLIDDWKAGSVA